MDQYAETIKYWDKVKSQFYIMDFDPVKDYNIEFIFRQMMTVFGVVDNEKIGSVSVAENSRVVLMLTNQIIASFYKSQS